MHALVFRVTIHEREEADRLLHEEFVPGMSQAPGSSPGTGCKSARTKVRR